MKRIETQGIYCIEPLDGSREWYWGMDYTGGDLYEAEELFRQGHPVLALSSVEDCYNLMLKGSPPMLLEPILPSESWRRWKA